MNRRDVLGWIAGLCGVGALVKAVKPEPEVLGTPGRNGPPEQQPGESVYWAETRQYAKWPGEEAFYPPDPIDQDNRGLWHCDEAMDLTCCVNCTLERFQTCKVDAL